ncbi:hypothetical protein RI129_010445 [Pyrocoelia pectoralis]|uniref:Protein sleepless n=1 Tax=Pyrocoelia pectoralis TaxID=417401 RepID=A0AAN7VAH2_9COLE
MNLKFTFSLLMLLFSLHSAHSIKCWDCRSDFDPKCGHPFDNSTFPITDCNFIDTFQGKSKGCRIMKKKENDIWIYNRSCAPPEEPQFDSERALCSNSNVECHTCYKNGCNSF